MALQGMQPQLFNSSEVTRRPESRQGGAERVLSPGGQGRLFTPTARAKRRATKLERDHHHEANSRIPSRSPAKAHDRRWGG